MYILRISIALFLLAITNANADPQLSRQDRTILMAQQAVISSLMLSRNPASQHICSENDYACIGVDQGELGINILGNSHGKAWDQALVDLVRFRLDGSLGEDYSCFLLERGKSSLVLMQKMQVPKLSQECQNEVSLIKERNIGKFNDLKNEDICASETEIKDRAKDLIKSLVFQKKCVDENF